jgi:hypothetical protein
MNSIDAKTRILIGASSYADATAALNILGALKIMARFGGLFVEESDALDQCQILNQRIVTSSGTLMFVPNRSQIRTVIEADAKAFRKSLALMADPLDALWTFERSVGDLVQISLEASSGWDIVVLGHRNLHPGRGKIVFFGASRAQDSPLKIFADHLARRYSAAQLVFSVGQGPAARPEGQSFETFQEALVALARMNVLAVLVDLKDGPIRSKVEIRQLLDAARCPVFTFGAAASDSFIEHNTQIPPAPGAAREPNET